MNEYMVVFITTSSKEEGKKIISHLIEEQLIACGTISTPVTSYYVWNQTKEQNEEFEVKLKTVKHLLPKLISSIEKMHSYQTPQIIACPIIGMNEKYKIWLEQTLS